MWPNSPAAPVAPRTTVGLDEAEPGRPAPRALGGLLWAGAAGLLWGSCFVPAQWAAEPAQVSNFPLALGILGAGLALALPAGESARLGLRALTTQFGAGVLFGIGNFTLLGLVARMGTGTGFTIAQLSLLVNASITSGPSALPSRARRRRGRSSPASRSPGPAAASSAATAAKKAAIIR